MPTDPSAFPGDIYAGPYGFLVAIAFFIYLAAREFRRGRQIDVQTYQGDLKELNDRLQRRDEEHKQEVADLNDSIEDLKADLRALRDESMQAARLAARKQEELIRENAALRALLATNGISTEGIPG